MGGPEVCFGAFLRNLFLCTAALSLRDFGRFARISSMHFFGVQSFGLGRFLVELVSVQSSAAIKILDTKVQVDCHEWCSPGCFALVPYTFLNHFGSRYKR